MTANPVPRFFSVVQLFIRTSLQTKLEIITEIKLLEILYKYRIYYITLLYHLFNDILAVAKVILIIF